MRIQFLVKQFTFQRLDSKLLNSFFLGIELLTSKKLWMPQSF